MRMFVRSYSGSDWLIGLGISLPILAFFALLGWHWLAATSVPPPGHDLLFTLESVQKSVPVDFYIEDGRTMVRNSENAANGVSLSREQLYLFEYRTQSIRRIPMGPQDLGAGPIAVRPDLHVLPAQQAPDGWRVSIRETPPLFSPLFATAAGSSTQSHLVMDNLSARVRIPMPPEVERAQCRTVEFLGWVDRTD